MRPTDPVVVELPTGHEAVRVARRFAVGECTRVGFEELAEDAELVASELVGNAILHTPGALRLTFTASEGGIRLEVLDRSPVPPVRVNADDGAMTGRGLQVVRALARRWGVTPTDEGKVVWAEIAATGGTLPDLEEAELPEFSGGDQARHRVRYHVSLGHVPTALLLDAKAHVDDLVREFALAAAGAEAGMTPAVPAQLAEVIERVVTGFADARQAIKRQAIKGAARGLSYVRLELDLPAEAVAAGEAYLQGLDDADRYCRAARLLTLETPPEHKVFRRWYVDEVIAQLRNAVAGRPPRPTRTFEERLLQEVAAAAQDRQTLRRSARLERLAGALAGALTSEAVAAAVLDEGVTALGAMGGGVLLAGEAPTLTVPGTVGYDEVLVQRLRHESRDAELPAAHAARTGEAIWLESPEERDARFPGLVGLERDTVSMCAVPLEVAGRRIGALRFSFREPRLFDDEERQFVLALAGYTAQAFERAGLHQEQTENSRRLQLGLLPPRLPGIPGVDLAAAYRPLGDGIEVGGDFYDAWPVGEAWAIAIGDVCGTGPEAAAFNALVRYTLRATTRFETDPERVLRTLNATLLDMEIGGPDSERFCTALFGILRVRQDGWEVTVAGGGHPGPLLRRSSGAVEQIELESTLLGIIDDPEIAVVTTTLEEDAVLLLFTDGATEARYAGTFLDTDGLARLLADAGGPAERIVAQLVEGIASFAGGRLLDDLALLAVRPAAVSPPDPPPGS